MFEGDGHVPAATVDLVAEIADTTADINLGRLADLYAAASTLEYWVVNLDARATRVHSRPSAAGYAVRVDIPFDSPLGSATIPGLDLGVATFG